MSSASEQGIAGFGAGDAERESAKLSFLAAASASNNSLAGKPAKTFTVHAATKWNPSDFAIQEGETYSIFSVNPNISIGQPQMWFDGGLMVDSQGYSSHFDAISNCYVALGRCRPHLKKRRRIPTANWMVGYPPQPPFLFLKKKLIF
jgi:hypothetical protein